MEMGEFYVTELSLYNTDHPYPWELAPEDVQYQLENKLDNDHDAVFNALTKNGTMEGIYVDIDENGNEHFYFNGTHIKAGSIDGGLIDGTGLNIKDELSGESIFHVYTDENGTHIDMIAKNLYIGTEPASTKDYAEQQAAQAEINAVGYTNDTVAENRAASEKMLNENINATARVVTENMTSYIDSQIEATITANNDQINSSISGSANDLTALINQKTAKMEEDMKEYIDDQISDLSGNLDSSIGDVNNGIEASTSTSKEYTDEQILAVKKDLENHTDTMNKYISEQVKTITDSVNAKADQSALDGIITRVTTLETNTKISAIVNAVLASTEYKNSLNTKLDVAVFNEQMTSVNDKLSNLTGTIASPKDAFYSKNFFSNNNISFTSGSTEAVTLDKLLDAITITTSDTTITMDVSKLNNTNYITVSSDNTKAYLNINEIIKFLIYKIKELESKMQ